MTKKPKDGQDATQGDTKKRQNGENEQASDIQHRAQVLPLLRPQEETEESPEESPHAYGLYRSPGGGYGVELFLSDGSAHSLPYTQIVMISTSPKADTLTIQCSIGALVVVTGHNLAPLRTALLYHRAAFLKAAAQGPGDTVIQDIAIEHPGPQR